MTKQFFKPFTYDAVNSFIMYCYINRNSKKGLEYYLHVCKKSAK